VLTATATAHAEQFVLLDVTFTFTKSDADNATPSKSHYYVKSDRLNAATPIDWTKPIDYRNGTVHVRTEVMDKPAGSAETRWTLCYIARKGIDAGYGCSNTAAYKEEGVWDFEQGMTEWWQNDNIDWTQGIKQMDLVMKDSKGVFAHTMPDPEHWFPTTLRITMIQISAGSTYDPSQVPGLPSGSGGAGGGGGMGGSAGAGGSATAGSASDPTTGGTSAGTGTGGTPATAGAGAPSTSGGGTASGGSSAGGMAATAGAPSATSGSGATDQDGGCSVGSAHTPHSQGLGLAGLGLALVTAWRRRGLARARGDRGRRACGARGHVDVGRPSA
jgi:MYXO-CTERM domain-containing protein